MSLESRASLEAERLSVIACFSGRASIEVGHGSLPTHDRARLPGCLCRAARVTGIRALLSGRCNGFHWT